MGALVLHLYNHSDLSRVLGLPRSLAICRNRRPPRINYFDISWRVTCRNRCADVPFSVSAKKVGDEYEAERLTKVVAGDDESFALGQFLLFGMFLLTLFFALVCKWLVFGQVAPIGIASRSLSAISAATAIFSLLWSVRLPFMLSLLAQQRKTLS